MYTAQADKKGRRSEYMTSEECEGQYGLPLTVNIVLHPPHPARLQLILGLTKETKLKP